MRSLAWDEVRNEGADPINSHLRPGVGHLEQVEIDFEPRCDDGSLPERSVWRDWYLHLTDATDRLNRPIAYNHNTEQVLRDSGFVDVTTLRISIPIGEWRPGRITLGRWMRVALAEAVEPLSLAVLTRPFYSWPAQDVKEYCREVSQTVNCAEYHAYHNLYV